jgi:hypothetical protein
MMAWSVPFLSYLTAVPVSRLYGIEPDGHLVIGKMLLLRSLFIVKRSSQYENPVY